MPNNRIDSLIQKKHPANDEIQRGRGYQLSTDVIAQPPPSVKVKTPPLSRQSVRIRKDLLLRSEAQKLERKKKGDQITLAEIIELALEDWLSKEEAK